jgi:spore germination protein YaaH
VKNIKSILPLFLAFFFLLGLGFLLNDSDENPFLYAAWVPNWAGDAGYESLLKNKDFINSASPVWHHVLEDGTLEFKPSSNYKEMIQLMKNEEMEIIPSIPLFDHEIFSRIANDEALFSAHVNALIEIGLDENYDGIDIDYESIQLKDKDKYYQMLKEVSESLHANGKSLVVTALSEWDTPEYSNLVETHEVLDYGLINEYADEIRIMTYDYTHPKMLSPGPIAPLNWQREVIEYALAQEVPAEKFVLGVHLYGYEWFNEKSEDAEEDEVLDSMQHDLEVKYFPEENSDENLYSWARAYTYELVQKALKFEGEAETYEGEQIYRYTREYEDGLVEERVLVYLNPEGVAARIALAEEYGLKGVAFWRLGGDGALLEEAASFTPMADMLE